VVAAEKRKKKKSLAVGLGFRWWLPWVSVSGGGSQFQVVAVVGLGFRWWLPWVSPCFNRKRRESESTERREKREIGVKREKKIR
jgi:hypothetical protein